MSLRSDLTGGIVKENPIFRLLLGMCPTLAVSTAVANGLGMGIAVLVVLVCSNLIISLIKSWIPSKIRIPAYIVVIATFVTMVAQIMEAFAPPLYEVLGIFVPLIVVNCIILGRAEAFASKNPVLNSVMDGIGMGIGYTLALVILSFVRELLGTGTVMAMADFNIQGLKVFAEEYGALIMILPPGAFITLGLILGFLNYMGQSKKRVKAGEGCH
jgi:electron transport complex protein RnfE